MEGVKIAGKYGSIKWHVQKVLRLVWSQCIDATTWDPYVHNQYASTYYIHMYRHNKWRTKSWWPMIPTSIQIYNQLVFATAKSSRKLWWNLWSGKQRCQWYQRCDMYSSAWKGIVELRLQLQRILRWHRSPRAKVSHPNWLAGSTVDI